MALSPEYLQGLPEELENLAMQLEADIIADISRRIAKAGAITDTAEYQMMILKEMGASTEYLEKLIAEYTGQSEEAVRELVFDAAQTDSDFYEAVYSRANRPYTPFEYNEYLQQLAVAAVNQTCGELNNFTRTMGFSVRGADGSIRFTSAADTYRACMDKAFTLAAFGGADYETAVRTATKEMTASGLQFVDYASGVRNHADVAVRRALLTGVSQMTGQISLHNARDLDTDIVEVSAHAGARPDHAEWQGLWFSISGEDKRYPQLEAATGYGTVTGLKGANCRHDFYPVIPGISERTYSDEDLRNIDPPPVTIDGKTYTYYEAEQRQRAIERAIRKTKREIIAAEASGDKDMFTAKSVLLRRQKEAYAEFSKKAGLLPRIERTGVAEYGRSISTKAVWAERKAGLTSSAKGGTMNSRGNQSTTSTIIKPTSICRTNEGSSALSSRNKQKLLRYEELNTGRRTERAIVIDKKGNRLFSKDSGLESKVVFTDDEMRLMKDTIITHNHNDGSPLSSNDIHMVIQTHAAEIRASCGKGAYVFRFPQSKYTPKKLETVNKRFYEYECEYAEKNRIKLINKEISFEEYDHSAQQYAVEKFAKKYHADYFFEER